jgi:hypothetical protein
MFDLDNFDKNVFAKFKEQKGGHDDGLLKACTDYTTKNTKNKNITCEQGVCPNDVVDLLSDIQHCLVHIGLLARSGVEFLRSFLPDTKDKPNLAPLRILDSFTLTNGEDACNYSVEGDGRHFYHHDMLQLRVLAEGALAVLEGSNNFTSSQSFTNDGKFLSPEDAAVAYARTMELPADFDSLLRRAFGRRHVAFIGDSTTVCMHHHLAAWLLTSTTSKFNENGLR